MLLSADMLSITKLFKSVTLEGGAGAENSSVVEHWTLSVRDQKAPGLSPGRNGGRIFFCGQLQLSAHTPSFAYRHPPFLLQ